MPAICSSKLPTMLGRWGSRVPNSLLSSTNSTSIALNGTQCRFNSDDCFKSPTPKCGQRFTKPCSREKEKKKVIRAAVVPPLEKSERSIIPEKIPDVCCPNPCREAFPRFDVLYYKRTDKLSRRYQQTWAECPEVKIVKRPICRSDKIPWEKRPKVERPATARKQTCADQNEECKRIDAPFCKKGRVPPSCVLVHGPNNCKKRKAPYPSYSECRRDRRKRQETDQCCCILPPSMCSIWQEFHRMSSIKKVEPKN